MRVESEYCYFRPFGPTNFEFRPLVAIGVFSPLNFKTISPSNLALIEKVTSYIEALEKLHRFNSSEVLSITISESR